MKTVSQENHNYLLEILDELLQTILELKKSTKDFLLIQNENELKEWIVFLKGHTDKVELKSLEDEIADRLVFKFDVQICVSELDKKRTELMKKFLLKSNEYLKD